MAQYLKSRSKLLGNNDDVYEVIMIADENGVIVDSDNPLPVTIGGESVQITGPVTIPGEVEVSNNSGDPLSVDVTGGTVEVTQGTIPWVVSAITSPALPAGFGQVHKFGAVPEMSQDQNGTIWDVNDTIYPWATIDAETTLTVTVVEPNNESNTSTALSGDTVEIQGLDANFDLLTETVTISGSTATTVGVFKRVFRAIYRDTGTTANSKIILIQSAGTTVAKILENIGQTMMSVYTIPAGKTGYLQRLDVTAQGTATGSFKLYVREGETGTFAVKHVCEVNGVGGPYQLEYPVAQAFPEKTDIDARMHTFSNNGRYTCTFDILLVDN